MTSSKLSYHPGIILAFYLDTLPSEILSQIPKSTIKDWSRRENKYTFGIDWVKENRSSLTVAFLNKTNQQLCKRNLLLIKLLALNHLVAVYKSEIKCREHSIVQFIENKITALRTQIPITKLLKAVGLSAKSYYHIKKKDCSSSLSRTCPLKHPQQLLNEEVEAIRDAAKATDLERNSIASVYYQMKRQAKASCCLNSFYGYWHKLGLSMFKRFKKTKKTLGMRAEEALMLIHIDITKYRLQDNSIAYIYVVKDNYSRMILELKAYKEIRAIHTQEILAIIIEKYFGADNTLKQIMTDGGSENSGIKSFILKYSILNLKHIVAHVDVDYSNSMVEAANKTLKYSSLFLEKILNHEHLETFLPGLKTKMNNTMMTVLKGLTPQEVFDNKTYEDVYGGIQQNISRIDRIKRNKQINCCKLLNSI